MNQPNAAAKRFLATYTKTVKDYDEFIAKNMAVIAEYESKQETKRLKTFQIQEQIDMLVEEGKIPVDIFMENELVEVKVRPDGEVRLFEKKLYGTAHLQETKK